MTSAASTVFDLTTAQTSATYVKSYYGSSMTQYTMSPQPAWKAFANYSAYSTSQRVCDTKMSFPVYIVYDFTTNVCIDSYKLTISAYTGGSAPGRAPKTLTFSGSSDGSTWTTLDPQRTETSWSVGETRTFTFDNATAYRYYRLTIGANNGDSTALEFFKLEYGHNESVANRVFLESTGGSDVQNIEFTGLARIGSTYTFEDGAELDGDFSWRGPVCAEGTLDLKGHSLLLASLTSGGTVTDSVGGGELIFDVPSDSTTTVASTLTGYLKLVKKGAGTIVCSKSGQTYTGGNDILAGTLRFGIGAGCSATDGYLGANSASVTCPVYIGPNGTLNPYGSQAWGYHALTIDGGTIYNTIAYGLSPGFNPAITVSETNNNWAFTSTALYYWGGTCNLGGGTLTLKATAADMYCNATLSNGTLKNAGGYFFTLKKNLDWSTANYKVTASSAIQLDYSLKVQDYYAAGTGYYMVGSGSLYVFGTFTPASASNYFVTPVMQDGSTIDLSAKTACWTSYVTMKNKSSVNVTASLSFASGATVNVELGSRTFSEGEQIISWTSEPSNVKFKSTYWNLETTSAGLFVTSRKGGTTIYLR